MEFAVTKETDVSEIAISETAVTESSVTETAIMETSVMETAVTGNNIPESVMAQSDVLPDGLSGCPKVRVKT